MGRVGISLRLIPRLSRLSLSLSPQAPLSVHPARIRRRSWIRDPRQSTKVRVSVAASSSPLDLDVFRIHPRRKVWREGFLLFLPTTHEIQTGLGCSNCSLFVSLSLSLFLRRPPSEQDVGGGGDHYHPSWCEMQLQHSFFHSCFVKPLCLNECMLGCFCYLCDWFLSKNSSGWVAGFSWGRLRFSWWVGLHSIQQTWFFSQSPNFLDSVLGGGGGGGGAWTS